MTIKEIQDKIDNADAAYYTTGKAVMEDAAYDKLRAELEKLDPTNVRITRVGAQVRDTILQKRKHSIPMGSQHKATNEGEYLKWLGTVNGANKILHASHKMDGASGSFEYRDGRLVSAVTRGDGIEGEDITANAQRFQGLPPVAKNPDGTLFSGFIRGEMMLRKDEWAVADPDQLKNPRNCGTGITRRKDGEESELITVYAFNIYGADGQRISDTEESAFLRMKAMGFIVVPYCVDYAHGVWSWYEAQKECRAYIPYWLDGIIVRVDNVVDQMAYGVSDNRPKGQVAIKFPVTGEETVIESVTNQVGHSGAITPVANLRPVDIGGTMITNASLANWDNIRELGVGVGDTVFVVKAGDIIPMVAEVRTIAKPPVPIVMPTECPVCKGPVGFRENVGGGDSVVLYCQSPGCPAKVFGKIEKFIKSVNILGLGEGVITSLINSCDLKDAAQLYALKAKVGVAGIASIVMGGRVSLGASRAAKILAEIDRYRKLTLSQFLGSLGIFGLGKRRVTIIQEALPGEFDRLDDWLSGKLIKMAKQAGLPNTAERIQKDLWEQKPLIEKFMKNGVEIVQPEAKAPVKKGALLICITGKLENPKSFYWDLIKQAGHSSTDDFMNAVTHLVAADPSGGSNKLQKARKAGIPILDEAGLLQLLASK